MQIAHNYIAKEKLETTIEKLQHHRIQAIKLVKFNSEKLTHEQSLHYLNYLEKMDKTISKFGKIDHNKNLLPDYQELQFSFHSKKNILYKKAHAKIDFHIALSILVTIGSFLLAGYVTYATKSNKKIKAINYHKIQATLAKLAQNHIAHQKKIISTKQGIFSTIKRSESQEQLEKSINEALKVFGLDRIKDDHVGIYSKTLLNFADQHLLLEALIAENKDTTSYYNNLVASKQIKDNPFEIKPFKNKITELEKNAKKLIEKSDINKPDRALEKNVKNLLSDAENVIEDFKIKIAILKNTIERLANPEITFPIKSNTKQSSSTNKKMANDESNKNNAPTPNQAQIKKAIAKSTKNCLFNNLKAINDFIQIDSKIHYEHFSKENIQFLVPVLILINVIRSYHALNYFVRVKRKKFGEKITSLENIFYDMRHNCLYLCHHLLDNNNSLLNNMAEELLKKFLPSSQNNLTRWLIAISNNLVSTDLYDMLNKQMANFDKMDKTKKCTYLIEKLSYYFEQLKKIYQLEDKSVALNRSEREIFCTAISGYICFIAEANKILLELGYNSEKLQEITGLNEQDFYLIRQSRNKCAHWFDTIISDKEVVQFSENEFNPLFFPLGEQNWKNLGKKCIAVANNLKQHLEKKTQETTFSMT